VRKRTRPARSSGCFDGPATPVRPVTACGSREPISAPQLFSTDTSGLSSDAIDGSAIASFRRMASAWPESSPELFGEGSTAAEQTFPSGLRPKRPRQFTSACGRARRRHRRAVAVAGRRPMRPGAVERRHAQGPPPRIRWHKGVGSAATWLPCGAGNSPARAGAAHAQFSGFLITRSGEICNAAALVTPPSARTGRRRQSGADVRAGPRSTSPSSSIALATKGAPSGPHSR
jgi:hypothetical protein